MIRGVETLASFPRMVVLLMSIMRKTMHCNVVDSSDDVSQYKWEHWPSPASPQEMGLQCTKKDWPRLAKTGQVATFERPKFLPIELIVAIILIPMSQMGHPTMYQLYHVA